MPHRIRTASPEPEFHFDDKDINEHEHRHRTAPVLAEACAGTGAASQRIFWVSRAPPRVRCPVHHNGCAAIHTTIRLSPPIRVAPPGNLLDVSARGEGERYECTKERARPDSTTGHTAPSKHRRRGKGQRRQHPDSDIQSPFSGPHIHEGDGDKARGPHGSAATQAADSRMDRGLTAAQQATVGGTGTTNHTDRRGDRHRSVEADAPTAASR
jgi:hypothetical protein